MAIEFGSLPLKIPQLDVNLSTRASEITLENTNFTLNTRLPAGKVKVFHSAYTNVAAGGSAKIFSLNGRGRILHAFLHVSGTSTRAEKTSMEIYFDGETTPSFVLGGSYNPRAAQTNIPAVFMTGFTAKTLSDIYVGQHDDTNYIYSFGVNMDLRFYNSISVTVKNADTSNGIYVEAIIIYQTW